VRLQVRSSQWISRALVVALVLAAAPLPGFAGEPPAPAPPTLAAAIQHAAAVTPLAPARGRSSAAQTGKADLGSPSFFKKPAGIAVLATLAAGIGYAVYSTQHDRVNSPGKKK
jgi:hypothetical protein